MDASLWGKARDDKQGGGPAMRLLLRTVAVPPASSARPRCAIGSYSALALPGRSTQPIQPTMTTETDAVQRSDDRGVDQPLATVNGPAEPVTPLTVTVTQICPGFVAGAAPLRARML